MYKPKAKPEKKNKAISSSDKVALSPSTVHYEFMIDGDLTAIQASIYEKATGKRTSKALIYASKRLSGIEEKLKEENFLERLNKKVFEDVLSLAGKKETLAKIILVRDNQKGEESILVPTVGDSGEKVEMEISELIEKVRADIAEDQRKISKKLKKLVSKKA